MDMDTDEQQNHHSSESLGAIEGSKMEEYGKELMLKASIYNGFTSMNTNYFDNSYDMLIIRHRRLQE